MTTYHEPRVVLVGMDDRTEAAFRILFSRGGRCLNFCEIGAELIIIDRDHAGSLGQWEEARKLHPEAYSLVISHQLLHEGDAFLRKPFMAAELHALILRLCEEQTVAPSLEDSPFRQIPPKLHDPIEATYDPQKYLQHQLQEAVAASRRENVNILISIASHDIIFVGSTNTVHTDLADNTLRPLCLVPVTTGLLSSRRTSLGPEIATLSCMSFEAILWKVAMWTARGRLPHGCNPDRAVRLRRWPNLTRLTEIPNALRMSALWNSQPLSPNQMVERLNIAPRHVFDFFSACHALDLMILPGDVSTVHAYEEKPHSQRNVMSWILERLRAF